MSPQSKYEVKSQHFPYSNFKLRRQLPAFWPKPRRAAIRDIQLECWLSFGTIYLPLS